MPQVKIPIQTLNGGVSTRHSTKRLPKEVEKADNVLLTVNRSAEKRPPITHITTSAEGDFLNIPNVNGGTPPLETGLTNPADYYNTDNLYFHFIDVDGANRFCVVINRAVRFTNEMVKVFRIEPTEWIEQEFDPDSFDRGMMEYLMHYNLKTDGDGATPIEDIMGSVTFGAGAIFYNKQKELGFLPDNSDKVKVIPGSDVPEADQNFFEPHPGFIHAGDKFAYKTADMNFVTTQGTPCNDPLPDAIEEDAEVKPYEPSKDSDGLYSKWISILCSPTLGGGYKNVFDDIESRVNSASLETYEVGHSLENFGDFPLPPVADDINSHNGWKARAALKHLYHRNENGIPQSTAAGAVAATGTILFSGTTITDGTTIVFTNYESTRAQGNVPLGSELVKFEFDSAVSGNTTFLNSRGAYVVGTNGLGSTTAIATALSNAIALNSNYTKIDASIDNSNPSKILTNHLVLGTHGNINVVVTDINGAVITPSDFSITGMSGGVDAPDAGYLTSPFSDIKEEGSLFNFPAANDAGFGEIYYSRNPFFSFPSAFYRVVSNSENGQPYFQQVRAEDKNSIIDHRTMPVRINRGSDGVWRMSYCPLVPKTTGSAINNPGPTAIKNKEKIKAMEFWKGRLWIATETTIFASRINDFFNYFIEDIQNITDSDPIDVSVNTGQFNLIQSLTAFQNFLFITTKSGTQFEIRGSATNSGTVSPTSIELRNTSFYSTAATVSPVKMGNNIYFFDEKKLFLYSGSDAFGNEYSTAFELSERCDGFLPKKFKAATAIPAVETLVVVNKEKPNELYLYTTKNNGQQILQNSFYRWVLDTNDEILDVMGYEGGMYLLVKRSNGPSNAVYAYFATFETVSTATPLLDRLVKLSGSAIEYDAGTNYTHVTLPYYDGNANEIVLGPDWGAKAYSRFQAIAVNSVQYDGHYLTKLTFRGNLASQRSSGSFVSRSLWAGRPYTMDIELSPIQYRDSQNIAQQGFLNLKKITTKHKDTGQYDIEVKRYNRKTSSVRSESFTFNDTTDLLGSLRIDSEGELVSKVLGNADSTSISIKSDYPTPCNITGLDILGNFVGRDSSIQK